jgi:hypothetical protein
MPIRLDATTVFTAENARDVVELSNLSEASGSLQF